MPAHPLLQIGARRAVTALACVLFSALSLSAQSAGTGAITGRVEDRTAGLSLEKARVTVEGTSRQVFTDEAGEYRFADIPAGQVTLRVFYTGRAAQTATVTVQPG